MHQTHILHISHFSNNLKQCVWRIFSLFNVWTKSHFFPSKFNLPAVISCLWVLEVTIKMWLMILSSWWICHLNDPLPSHPIHHVVVGLSGLDSAHTKELAFSLAQRWIQTNWRAYIKYEAMFEKVKSTKFHSGLSPKSPPILLYSAVFKGTNNHL